MASGERNKAGLSLLLDCTGFLDLLHEVVVPFRLGLEYRFRVVDESLDEVMGKVNESARLPDGMD